MAYPLSTSWLFGLTLSAYWLSRANLIEGGAVITDCLGLRQTYLAFPPPTAAHERDNVRVRHLSDIRLRPVTDHAIGIGFLYDIRMACEV